MKKISILKPNFFIALIPIIAIYFIINKWVLTFDDYKYYFAIKSWNLIQVKPSLYISLAIFCLLLLHSKTRKVFLNTLYVPKEIKRGIHIFILLVSWFYLFYDYNFYANNWHLFDRCLVLFTALLAIKFPVFSLFFVGQIYLIDYQFNFPLGGSKLLDKSVLLEIIKIWASFNIVLIINKNFIKNKLELSIQHFFLMIIGFYGFFYFIPGLQKIILSGGFGWPFENEITYNLLAIRNKGWLNTMPESIIDVHFWYFENFGTPGQIAVLFTEISALFLLISKKWIKLFILFILLFHLHVFVLNGALFWLWIIAGIFVFRMIKYIDNSLFSMKMILFSLLFTIVGYWGISTSNLGWYDSPLDNYFEIEATTTDGEVKKMSFSNFEPYTLHLQYGNFLSTINSKNIYPGFLILDKAVYNKVLQAEVDQIEKLIEENGKNTYNYEMEKNLNRFFDTYLHNTSPNPKISSILSYIQPPKYWNAHITDGLSTIHPTNIESLSLFHCCVKRELDQSESLIWRRNVCEIKKGERYNK